MEVDYIPSMIIRCNVCGDKAKGTNYGVISCMSCKVFFQRHVDRNIDNYVSEHICFYDESTLNYLDNI
jgi:hypothetical protein